MKYSNHAKTQAQRRGITLEHSELVLTHGNEHKSTRHCRVFRVTTTELKELKNDNPVLWRRYRDKMKVLTVASESGNVVSVKHQYSHKRLWKKITLNDRRDF